MVPPALPLTNGSTLAGWPKIQANQERPLRVEGVVTRVDRVQNILVLQNEGGALAMHMDLGGQDIRPGQQVRVESDHVAGWGKTLPKFPLSPNKEVWLSRLDTPVNHGDYYLARAHGYLIPPATGDYQFWIAGKTSSEFWLSTNTEASGLKRMANVPETKATLPRQWDKYPSQTSQTIHLNAGQPCLFDVVQEHRAGRDDTVAVAWQGPGLQRDVVDGRYLVPYAGDRSNGVLCEYWDDYLAGSLQPLTQGETGSAELVVANPSVQILGEGVFPIPIPLEIGSTLLAAQNFQWAELLGTVAFASTGTNEHTIELVRDRTRVKVKLPASSQLDFKNLRGTKIRVRGVCESAADLQGNPTLSVIWVPTDKQIAEAGTDASSLQRLKVVSLGELVPDNPALAPGRRVRVRGTVIRCEGEKIELQGTARFAAYVSNDGIAWRSVATPVDVGMGEVALGGLLVCASKPEEIATARFTSVSGIQTNAQDYQIPGASPAGSTRVLGEGSFLVNGAGIGFGMTFERFHLFASPWGQKEEISARIAGFEPSQPESLAGIMVRDSSDQRASFVSLTVSGGGAVSFRFRQRLGDRADVVNLDSVSLPCSLKLVRTLPTVAAQLSRGTAAKLGDTIDLIGMLQWDGQRPWLSECRCLDPVDLATSNSAMPSLTESANGPVAARIVNLLPERNEPLKEGFGSVMLRGVVTFGGPPLGANLLVLQDESAGILVRLNNRFSRRMPRIGELVEFEVHSQNGRWVLPLDPNRMQTLGRAQLPDPLSLTVANTQPRRGEYRWVECEGIVRAVNSGEQFRLMTASGEVPVWVGERSAELSRMIDALVRVRAVLVYRDNKTALYLQSNEHLEVVEPPPENAFSMPAITIDKVSSFARRPGLCHRVKVIGVVTCRSEHALVLQDNSGGARVMVSGAIDAAVGDQVEVAGFPELELASPYLSQALVRRLGKATMPEPMHISAAQLSSGNRGACLVQLSGQLLGQKIVDGNLVLEIQDGERLFRAELQKGEGRQPSIVVGSRLQVTGVSLLERLSAPFLSDRPPESEAASFGVLLRTPADVVVLETPPWWAWQYAAQVIGALGAVLVAALLWIRYLRLKVARRTRQLSEAMQKLEQEAQTSATLAERERLAGEIHDSVEQGLSAIIMQMDTAAKLVDRPDEVRRYLTLARNMAGFSRSEVHHAVWGLQSPLLDNADLPTALRHVAQDIGAGESPRVEVEVVGEMRALARDVEHHLVRAAQEAMTNAVKHGAPNRITVTLTYAAADVRLLVRDDGCGFDPEAVPTGGSHFGLRGLRNRAKKLRGTITITSRPGAGASIEIVVPANKIRPDRSTP